MSKATKLNWVNQEGRIRASIIELASLAFLVLFSLFFAIKFVNFSAYPIEDAAILMRYAQHFAEGYGIVWNIGEHPVDGATDFLFMISVGLLVKTGFSLEFATRSLGFVSHIMTVGLVYWSLRKLFNTPLLIALGTGTFLAVGPGFYYVAGYFGTPFFVLFACISWFLALSIIEKGEDGKISFLFAASSLITGLIRPEGCFLTAFMLLAVIFIKGWKGSQKTVKYYLWVFLLGGGIYMLWRWQYFGYPLPNPYYKKGGGLLHIDGIQHSYLYTGYLCLPLWPAFVIGLSLKKTLRKTIGYLIPIFGFATLFILLSNEMNVGARFQYVLLPLALMVWWPLTQNIRDRLKIPDERNFNLQQLVFFYLLAVMVSIGAIVYEYNTACVRYYYDGKYTIATFLSQYRNLRLATSEAGILPLYSQLKSLDTWGLNDQWIAHHGEITEEYLRSFDPDIIMFHAYFSPIASSDRNDNWSRMTILLNAYAEKNGYILAASFGDNPYNTEYYYVRSNLPESEEIVGRIRETEYYSFMSGKLLTNYALEAGK